MCGGSGSLARRGGVPRRRVKSRSKNRKSHTAGHNHVRNSVGVWGGLNNIRQAVQYSEDRQGEGTTLNCSLYCSSSTKDQIHPSL